MRMGASLSARRRRHTSTPSSFGRPRSRITRSGMKSSASSSAATPSAAERTSWPSWRRVRRRTSAISASSSTTSTRPVTVSEASISERLDLLDAKSGDLYRRFIRRGRSRCVEFASGMLSRTARRRSRRPPARNQGRSRSRGHARPRGGRRDPRATAAALEQRHLDLIGLGLMAASIYMVHGGIAGEALYWAATTLFQRLGAHILAVLMAVSGALLLTGTTVSGLVSRAGRAARTAGAGTRELAKTVRLGGLDGADPDGDQLAITRADPTEALATDVLAESDAGEAETVVAAAHEEDHEWVADEPEPPHANQFAYAEGDEDEAGDDSAVPGKEAAGAGVTPMGSRRSAVTESDELDYCLPAPKLLDRGKGDPGPDVRDREAVAKALLEALRHFGVDAKLLGVVSGPHVSRYELQLAPGTKVGAVAKLRDDLAYALASTDIRILAPIPGKKAVGVEVPNQRRRLVRLGDIYDGRPKGSSPLAVWLGKDVSGQAVWTDLALMPHALVAGTTGSGKSGSINAMLCSVLLHASPNEVRLGLVDPARVELHH